LRRVVHARQDVANAEKYPIPFKLRKYTRSKWGLFSRVSPPLPIFFPVDRYKWWLVIRGCPCDGMWKVEDGTGCCTEAPCCFEKLEHMACRIARFFGRERLFVRISHQRAGVFLITVIADSLIPEDATVTRARPILRCPLCRRRIKLYKRIAEYCRNLESKRNLLVPPMCWWKGEAEGWFASCGSHCLYQFQYILYRAGDLARYKLLQQTCIRIHYSYIQPINNLQSNLFFFSKSYNVK
jgi:hypothetical protein